MKKDFILEIYRSKNSVFTFKDIAMILEDGNAGSLKSRVHYYVKKGVLRSVRNGIYVKPEYDVLELASKIYTPAYVSLETVLEREGVIFQYYDSIFVLSYLSREINVDGHQMIFRKIKNDILLNPQGIVMNANKAVATKERAFLDALYMYKNYHFDHLDTLDKGKIEQLAGLYHSQTLMKRVRKYFS